MRATELRFTAEEASDFLNEVMGLDLTMAHVEALEDRTEGWAAGLQLAGLSLRGRAGPGDVSAFIEAFTGSNRFVVDYLADEVLAQQPAHVREFLLRTSVLERLTGSLCAAVTGQPESGALLDRLDRDNLFVVPLDHDRTWFRYHHLFADVLRARLMAADPAVVDQLHRDASDWYATHDSYEDAIRHAPAGVHLYRAALAQARGDSEGTAKHARAALALARREDHFIRAGGSGFLGLAAWARGDITEALPTFEESVAALRAAGNHVEALDATIVLAGMWVTAGRPTKARTLCEQALATATADGEPYPHATADLHTWLADLALARNDLASADDELATAAALAERSSITENQHRWPTVAAGVRTARGEYEQAPLLLDEAARLTAPASTPTYDRWPPRRFVSS